MSIPTPYTTCTDYLLDVFHFLKSYQWIYNCKNTHILVNKVFEHFPPDWLEYLKSLSYQEISQLNSLKDNTPNSLKSFLNQIDSLKPKVSVQLQCIEFDFLHNSGLSQKKLHEIKSFAPLIHNICKDRNINFIVDIGSGLGYLSHLLYEKYGYSVIGIEGDSEKINLAYKNQSKYYSKAKNSVTFINHFITDNSSEFLTNLLNQQSKNGQQISACLVGLHACADLSITILELFNKIENFNSLVIMPCCYHRIELNKIENNREYFKYFPVSKLYNNLFEQFDGYSFIKRPFLRLACQQSVTNFTNMSEMEHEKHAKNCLYRSILQEVAEEMDCQVKRLKRKSGHKTTSSYNCEDDFGVYLKRIQNSHILEQNNASSEKLNINDDRFTKNMWKKWQDNKSNCYLMEVLTGLQAAIQSVCENFVLLDRVEFLNEKGFHCVIEKVTNDSISPRCYALVTTR